MAELLLDKGCSLLEGILLNDFLVRSWIVGVDEDSVNLSLCPEATAEGGQCWSGGAQEGAGGGLWSDSDRER